MSLSAVGRKNTMFGFGQSDIACFECVTNRFSTFPNISLLRTFFLIFKNKKVARHLADDGFI